MNNFLVPNAEYNELHQQETLYHGFVDYEYFSAIGYNTGNKITATTNVVLWARNKQGVYTGGGGLKDDTLVSRGGSLYKGQKVVVDGKPENREYANPKKELNHALFLPIKAKGVRYFVSLSDVKSKFKKGWDNQAPAPKPVEPKYTHIITDRKGVAKWISFGIDSMKPIPERFSKDKKIIAVGAPIVKNYRNNGITESGIFLPIDVKGSVFYVLESELNTNAKKI